MSGWQLACLFFAGFFAGFRARSFLTWALYMAKGRKYDPVTEVAAEAEQ